jgi:hypothetical protein
MTSHYPVSATSWRRASSKEPAASSTHDYTALKEKEKLRFPRDTLDVDITLTQYVVLCQAMFQGVEPTHNFVERVWQLVAATYNATP